LIDYRQAYWSQKCSAGKRNIEWHFTYETWLAWWGDDIVNRGKGKGKMVMGRHGDVGPYNAKNCKKITMEENFSEGNKGKPKNADWCVKQSQTRIGVKRGTYQKHT